MSTQIPVIKNDANGAIFYTSLASQATPATFQANPTLAAGDVKISIDGGSFNNLATLPTVTPASGKAVKITLSQAETNGDNLTIVFSDAAGAEWSDQVLTIQTSARHFDDLAFPTTSGRSIDVDASGGVEIGSIQAGAIAAAAFAANALDAVWSATTRLLTAGTNIVLAKGVGVTGFNDLSAASVNAEVDTALADYDGPTHTEMTTELATADDATLAAISGLSIPTSAEISDAVWDEDLSGHTDVGSSGAALSAAGSAGDPWSTPLPGSYGDGTAGSILGNVADTDDIQAAILTDATPFAGADVGAIREVTDTMPGDVASESTVINVASAIPDAVVDAVLTDATPFAGADIAAIRAVTDAIPGDPASESTIISAISAVLTTQMVESYAADGDAPTVSQALMLIQQMLTEMAISGTTMTIKKLDGSTTALTLTLNDATSPTSVTRAT